MIDRPLPPSRENERGTVLIMALAFTIIIGTLLVGTLTTTALQAKTMRHALDKTYAQGLAEGATELAQFEMVDAASNFVTPPTRGEVMIGGEKVAWTATPLGGPVERFAADGVRMVGQPYEISAEWNEGVATSRISRVVDLTVTPLFQYAIFYNSISQISPGPNMTITGRVHVNGDLFLDTSATLTMDTDYLKATGNIYKGRVVDPESPGQVFIREFETTNFVELTSTNDSASAGWVQGSLSTWGGGVQTGAHGIEAVGVPELPTIESGGYYETTAGLRFVNTQAYDENGLMISLPAGVVTEQTLWDAREGANIKVTEIDIGLLASSGYYPTNGLLYARRTDSTTANPNGVRLVNGATLPTPLTVVTENPIYIWGDYNTVAKKPAAVIADALNLLSNSWDDSRTSESKLPVGAATTFNVSLIAGQVLDNGYGAGGFENLSRLHENWSGKQLTILGAFAVLFESQFATTPMVSGVYSPPQRMFSFDPDLLDPALLPPYSPSGVYMRRVLWDDNEPIIFKVADSRLSLFPSTPVYDPWTHDDAFMGKVIDDPNLYVDGKRQIDYSNKAEAEEPDTADRNTETVAEQASKPPTPAQQLAINDASDAATLAEEALSWALNKIASGQLVPAENYANWTTEHVAEAQAAYDASGRRPEALQYLQQAQAAEAAAWEALNAAKP